MSNNGKIERPVYQPRFLDREAVDAAQKLLKEAEAELQSLVTPEVRGVAGNGALAGTKLRQDAAQLRARVKALRYSVNHPYFGCHKFLKAQQVNVKNARTVLARDLLQVAVREQRKPGGPVDQIVKRSREAYEANPQITHLSWPDGGTVEASDRKTDVYTIETMVDGKRLYLRTGTSAPYSYERNGIEFRYSTIPMGNNSRRVILNGYPVYVGKNKTLAHFDKNGQPKPHLNEERVPVTRYRVVLKDNQGYEFKTAQKRAGAYQIAIRSGDGSQRFVTPNDYNKLKSNGCIGTNGRLIGYQV